MANYSPDYWFLPDNMINLNKGYTSKNEVTALIDGKSYYNDLFDRLSQLQAKSKVKICGWRLNPTTKLLGNLPGSRTFISTIGDIIDRGVEVKAMLWRVNGTIGNLDLNSIPDHVGENLTGLFESANDLIPGQGHENVSFLHFLRQKNQEAILDGRLAPGVFASHHQKFILMQDILPENSVAYVGGIDIAPDRWDVQKHDEPEGREPELFDAWHDVQAKVVGPVFSQLAECFYQRWNDRRKPSSISNVPSQLDLTEIPQVQGKGTCHIQVLQTYSCKTDTFSPGDQAQYPFAPDGEYSYANAYKKSIGLAEKYIYIEDQYFWPCDVVDALAEAAKREVTIILVLTNNYDVPGLIPYHNFLRNMSIEKLRNAGDHVYVYSLRQSAEGRNDIYVHAKTMIIDDRYAIIGSANINSRSMTTDSEIGVAIVDEQLIQSKLHNQVYECCKFAKEYRQLLWTEHLGIPSPDDPLNNDRSPKDFPVNQNVQQNHIIMHNVAFPRFCNPSFIPFKFMNTNTKCL